MNKSNFRKQILTFREVSYTIDFEFIYLEGIEYTTSEIDNRNINRLLNEYYKAANLPIIEDLNTPVRYPK